jgi:cytochrome c oxidase cbb3-type subunit 4
MELYTFLREMADSWALLALTLFFLGAAFWAFRPGSKVIHEDAANVIFKHDKKPGPVPAGPVPGPSKEA